MHIHSAALRRVAADVCTVTPAGGGERGSRNGGGDGGRQGGSPSGGNLLGLDSSTAPPPINTFRRVARPPESLQTLIKPYLNKTYPED